MECNNHETNLLNRVAVVVQLKIKVNALAKLREPELGQKPVPDHAIDSKDSLLGVLFRLIRVSGVIWKDGGCEITVQHNKV